MLNLNLLRIFHSVAHRQNVVKAASELYISQPAVSNAIKKLQKEYQVDLFCKEGRNIKLTETGKQLYAYSQQIFQLTEEADNFLRSLNQQTISPLRIGLVTLYERFYIDEILQLLKNIVPNAPITFVSGNSRTLAEKLESREVDLIFNARFVEHDDIKTKFFRKHRVCLAVPEKHELYGKKFFTPIDIENKEFLLKENGSAVRTAVDNYLEKHNISIIPKVELSNLDSIQKLAVSKEYLTFFPEINFPLFYPLWDSDCFLRSKNDDIYFSIYISCLKFSHYPPSMQDIVKKCYEELSD